MTLKSQTKGIPLIFPCVNRDGSSTKMGEEKQPSRLVWNSKYLRSNDIIICCVDADNEHVRDNGLCQTFAVYY